MGTSSFAISASFVNGDNLAVSFSNNSAAAISASEFAGTASHAITSSHATLALSGGSTANAFQVVHDLFVHFK